ncbi:MAG: ferredoxin [Gammaproteobacteria bacterium]|nr:ferredoxin [Gammaproteobacteria bacterium]
MNSKTKALLPVLPKANEENADLQKIMHVLRHFHLGNPTAAEQLESLTDDYLPALLAAYRDASTLRYDYPLYLSPVEGVDLTQEDEALAKPLSSFLQETVEGFAPDQGSALILKDNLPWIERYLGNVTHDLEGPVTFKNLMSDACQALFTHLKLDNNYQEKLQADLDELQEATPEGSKLLAYGRFPALHLLMHLIRSKVIPQLKEFKEDSAQYIQKLQTLLDVDNTKQDEAKSADTLKSNISSNHFFNAESLSNVVKHSTGSVAMSASRRQRIQDALKVLQAFKEKEVLIHIIHESYSLDKVFNQNACFATEHHEQPCLRATEIFDREAQELAKVFAAARIAKLEIDHLYDENIHDPWFNNFNWEAFSKKELMLVPSVIVLESSDRLANKSMVPFSHLLNSGRPVNIIARVQAHNNPSNDKEDDPFKNYRTELGYIGISHRQAVVSQSSAARHEHLLSHLNTALDATRTSLHLINVGIRDDEDKLDLNAWLVASAAIEGRAHPFFSVDPGAGDSAADRVDFNGNPQADKDWPVQPFTYRDEQDNTTDIELNFTFADYALLIPRLNKHFGLVPSDIHSDDIIPVAEFLSLPDDEVDNFIPYVWGVDKDNTLRKLIVSRALIHACRDRLNFWHTLQEMAGVRSQYIENAKALIQSDAELEVAKKVAQAKAEFDAELERVKTETASDVMSRLTDMLLGMDLSSGSVIARPAASSDSSAQAPVQEEAEEVDAVEEEPEEEEEASFEDAWIDSPLCTTCNDCTDMNPLMFVYNDSNQAFISDLNAGTYLQMVEAAEICPSKCIHPGKPWDDSEPDLDELVERAKVFN